MRSNSATHKLVLPKDQLSPHPLVFCSSFLVHSQTQEFAFHSVKLNRTRGEQRTTSFFPLTSIPSQIISRRWEFLDVYADTADVSSHTASCSGHRYCFALPYEIELPRNLAREDTSCGYADCPPKKSNSSLYKKFLAIILSFSCWLNNNFLSNEFYSSNKKKGLFATQ